ncbi:MAG: hypothetical protein FWC89_13105 [Defluviitaleaceae bacterium]|nr:hypothetical protein [Defluviitaleaceae bacterium]
MKELRLFSIVVLSLVLVVILVTVIIPMIKNPIQRPRGMVRNYILEITPMGTHIDDVINIIEGRDSWTLGRVDFEMGFSPQTSVRPCPERHPYLTVIGEMAVFANLGRYRAWYVMFGAPYVQVFARWGFDADGNLIEVLVQTSWIM